MKCILLFATLAICLTSCQKEQDYLCTIEQVNSESLNYHTKVVVPFRGTYAQMKAFEVRNSFGTPWVSPTWQSCNCR